MNVNTKSRKTTMNFYPGDLRNMIRDDFKISGWQNYQESPYKEYQNKLEELGYERYDKPGNSTQDS